MSNSLCVYLYFSVGEKMKKRLKCLILLILTLDSSFFVFSQDANQVIEVNQGVNETSNVSTELTAVEAEKSVEGQTALDNLSSEGLNPDLSFLPSQESVSIDSKSPLESFEKGKKFFRKNQPQLAIPYLENALTDSSIDSSAYIYLGVSYYQTAQFEKAIRINEAGMKIKDSNTSILAYNGGNAAFSLGDWDRADVMYSLSLTADPMYASAWLNRANTRMKQDRLDKAIDDYKQFLYIAPEDEQAPKIRILIGLLQEELNKRNSAVAASLAEIEQLKEELRRLTTDKEYLESKMGGSFAGNGGNGSGGGNGGNGSGGRGLSAEEANMLLNELQRVNAEKEAVEKEAALKEMAQEEASRLAAEKEAEEEARRQKIMQDIMNSLQNAESTNMSAGVEGTFEYDYESELD